MTFHEHLARHTEEALSEGFAPDVGPDTFAQLYSCAALSRHLCESGWARVWTVERDGHVVAHASVYDLGEGDVVFGHLGIEAPFRGQGIARELQAQRFAFLDEHGLTLSGAVAAGNKVSLAGCLSYGFAVASVNESGGTVVYRAPLAK